MIKPQSSTKPTLIKTMKSRYANVSTSVFEPLSDPLKCRQTQMLKEKFSPTNRTREVDMKWSKDGGINIDQKVSSMGQRIVRLLSRWVAPS